jgi:uncharacterized pyridoxamine 5'-phosphate oxidase family protein
MSNVDKVFSFLKDKTFYVATIDGDSPRVRPFGFTTVIGGKLYFGNNPEKPSYKQLQANPRIEISATSDDGQEWIRISGKAVYDIRPEIVDASFAEFPQLKEIYGIGAPPFAPFYIAEATAVFSSFTGEPVTVEF